jgi:hypothetical protein
MELYLRVCRLANKASWTLRWLDLEWKKDLEEAVEASGLPVTPKEVVYCAWTTAAAVFAASAALSAVFFMLGRDPILPFFGGLLAATAAAFFLQEYPKNVASEKRIKSLGRAPETVAYLIIPLKQNPNLEEAVRFAAEHGEGQMAEDLKKALKDVWAGEYRSVGEALPVLGFRWGRGTAGFEDAMYAIRSSQIEKSESRRLDALDRALESVLEGIRKRFEEFIGYLRVPTMLIFAGGAIFPLFVIILLPLVSLIGLDFSTSENTALLLAALVTGVFLFSEYTLAKRPAAFPPPNVPDDYPGLPKPGMMRVFGHEASAWQVSLGAAAAISSLSVPYLLGIRFFVSDYLTTLPLVVGAAAGLYLYLRGTSLPKKTIQDEMRRMEGEAVEAFFQLGNRLMSGMSAEEALVKTSELMDGRGSSAVSNVFDKTVKNIRYLNMGLEDSLFDETKGSLKYACSGMVESVFRIFSTTMKKSAKAASEALIVAAGHIKQIRGVEDSLREKLSYTTAMMRMTAVLINPMICALSVYISATFSEAIAKTESIGGPGAGAGIMLRQPSTSPQTLQLITGFYVLALLFVLLRYASFLEGGDDSISYRLEVSKGIPVALGSFVGVIALSNFL